MTTYCDFTLENGDDCRKPAPYVTGGGAAASWYFCEDHARHLCACEERVLHPDTENEHGEGSYHSRTECTGPEGFHVTRSANTPGGSLLSSR